MICIKTESFEFLTLGKFYRVISTTQYDGDKYITVINDGGVRFAYPAQCFTNPEN
jgi:hypothetical protein